MAIAEEMNLSSMSFSLALQDLASLLQKISMAQVLPQSVLEEWPEAEAVQRLAQQFTKEEVQLFYQIAIVGRSDLSLAPDELSGFMMTLLRMLAFKPDNDFGAPSNQGGRSGAQTPAPGNTKSPAQAAMVAATATQSAATLAGGDEVVTVVEVVKVAEVAKVTQVTKPVQQEAPKNSGPVDAPVDWQGLVRELPLRGLVKQFAYQTELKSWNDSATSVQLVLLTAMPQIATDDAITRLSQFLETQFGKPFKIMVEAGQTEKTVAVAQAQEKKDLQTMVEKQIATDPFILQLEKEIGAKVISGTQRPL